MSLLSEKKHLKTILQSKRANLYYLEYCRVLVNAGRVEYLTQDKDKQAYWNIPIANTTVLLLGNGTSITQKAVAMLSAAGVMIGFSGGGGTPLHAGMEVEWLSPQSEYRPTEYLQDWLSFWFDTEKRFKAAQKLQADRLHNLQSIWSKEPFYQEYGIFVDDPIPEQIIANTNNDITKAASVQDLLRHEARATKGLYSYIAGVLEYGEFTRNHAKDGKDLANALLDHGNYLAYGLAASALWTLGIPHGFAVMHGKTRRGALIFDIADLIKDALVLPHAFISAIRNDRQQTFRESLLDLFVRHKAMDRMIESVKQTCTEFGVARK